MGGPSYSKKRKVVDFKTVKRKLGKQYKGVTHTDLSFQTRSIAIPTQSIAVEKDQYVNSRNLGLGDLLTQCRHYNETTRREAVVGLKDLLLKYPVIMERQLSGVCDKLVELMLDSSGDVRMALHGLLNEILPLLLEDLVSPFFPLFVAYISTGMTHINQAVRLDALQYTNLWLFYHPNLVSKFHSKLLPHYLMLMNSKEPPPKMDGNTRIRRLPKEVKGPTEAKLHLPNALKMKTVLISSLYDLLVAQLGDDEDKSSTNLYNFDASEAKTAWKHLHLGSLNEDVVQLQFNGYNNQASVTVPFGPSYSLDEIIESNPNFNIMGNTKIESTTKQNVDLTPTESKLHLDDPECFKYFFTTVIPMLFSQWLECDPENIVPHALKPLGYILKLMVLSLSHLDSLIGSDPSSQAAKFEFLDEYLVGIKKYIFPVFPLDYQATWTEEQLSLVTHLNVLVAKLGSHFYHAETASENWAQSIVDYTLYAFSGKIARPTGRRSKKSDDFDKDHRNPFSSAPAEMTHFQIVSELLPVVRRLASYAQEESRAKLLKAFQAFNDACPPNSSSKRMCISFFADLLLNDQNEDSPSSTASKTDDTMDVASTIQEMEDVPLTRELVLPETDGRIPHSISDALLMSLPKTLWQLQAENAPTSHFILGILSHYGSKVQYVPSRRSVFEKLQTALVPFFWTSIQKKVKDKKSSKMEEDQKQQQDQKQEEATKIKTVEVYGPFVNLPISAQRAAVEVLAYLPTLNPQMLESLVHCVSSAKVGVDIVQYLLETVEYPRQFNDSLPDYISFLFSILVGVATKNNEAGMKTKTKIQRCFVISQLLAKRFLTLNLALGLLDVLEDQISGLLDQYLEESDHEMNDLAASLFVFLGYYLKLNKDQESEAEPLVPESIKSVLPKLILQLLLSTAASPLSNGGHPDLITVKDIFTLNPSILTRTLGEFLKHVSKENYKPTNEDKVIASDLVTKFRADIHPALASCTDKLEEILNIVAVDDAAHGLIRQAQAEVQLLKSRS